MTSTSCGATAGFGREEKNVRTNDIFLGNRSADVTDLTAFHANIDRRLVKD